MTPYERIFERFAQKITDYKMFALPENYMLDMWHGWLKSAVAKQKRLESELTMDDDAWCFPEDLIDIEIEVLAVGMAIEWLEPQVNSVTNTLQMFSSSDVKFFSQSAHLSEMRAFLRGLKIERKKLIRDYQYNVFARNGA